MTDTTYDRTRAQLRKLARQGRLVDEAFKAFQRHVYPGAPPEQVAALRIAFFAGAAEFHAMSAAMVDDTVDVTDADVAAYGQVVQEVERFHDRTIATMQAGGSAQ